MRLRKFLVIAVVFVITFFMSLMANCTLLCLWPQYAAFVGAGVAATLLVLLLLAMGFLGG